MVCLLLLVAGARDGDLSGGPLESRQHPPECVFSASILRGIEHTDKAHCPLCRGTMIDNASKAVLELEADANDEESLRADGMYLPPASFNSPTFVTIAYDPNTSSSTRAPMTKASSRTNRSSDKTRLHCNVNAPFTMNLALKSGTETKRLRSQRRQQRRLSHAPKVGDRSRRLSILVESASGKNNGGGLGPRLIEDFLEFQTR